MTVLENANCLVGKEIKECMLALLAPARLVMHLIPFTYNVRQTMGYGEEKRRRLQANKSSQSRDNTETVYLSRKLKERANTSIYPTNVALDHMGKGKSLGIN